MPKSYTAIDFETAQGKRWSICQVGLVRVENSVVKQEFSILVQPPDNYYSNKFIEIHGINSETTADAPTFDCVWHKIKPFIQNQHVVAHNGFAFDFHCLKETLAYYKIRIPKFTRHCTYRIFDDNLEALCKKYKISLNHHDALSDAKACAKLFAIYLKKNNLIL